MDAEQLSDSADEIAQFLRELAYPERLLVLACLATGERDTTQLRAETGLPDGLLDAQLARLRVEGMIAVAAETTPTRYRIEHPAVLDLMLSLRRNFYDEHDQA